MKKSKGFWPKKRKENSNTKGAFGASLSYWEKRAKRAAEREAEAKAREAAIKKIIAAEKRKATIAAKKAEADK